VLLVSPIQGKVGDAGEGLKVTFTFTRGGILLPMAAFN
jgi:hypothetical protein